MAATTRERALDAAVEVLGSDGVRALSHAGCDRRAGSPAGRRRTRSARAGPACPRRGLDRRARARRLRPGPMPWITGVDGLVDGLCAMTEVQAGPFATRTQRATRSSLSSRATPSSASSCAAAPHVRAVDRADRDHRRIADPAPATRALMGLCDGLLDATGSTPTTCVPLSSARSAPSRDATLPDPGAPTDRCKNRGAWDNYRHDRTRARARVDAAGHRREPSWSPRLVAGCAPPAGPVSPGGGTAAGSDPVGLVGMWRVRRRRRGRPRGCG